MHFLEVKNLSHNYSVAEKNPKPAINNISFTLDRGEILGIIGHTGSGKSTLVSHLNGLLKPDEGEIFYEGVNIWEKPKEISKIRSHIGLVFQYPEYQLFEETVYQDIAFGPKNMGLDAKEIDSRIRRASKLLGIGEELFDKSPFDLSGGQKRRVAIAGVLAMEPDIVVFDEPTAGLDPVGRAAIFSAIRNYRKERNSSVIIVSHSMEDMAEICDRILVMNNGTIYMEGPTEEVFSNRDALKNIGLNVPMIAEVFYTLKETYGLDLGNVITVHRALELLTDVSERRKSND